MRNFFREYKEKQKKINELQEKYERLNGINEILKERIKAFDEREKTILNMFIKDGSGVAKNRRKTCWTRPGITRAI